MKPLRAIVLLLVLFSTASFTPKKAFKKAPPRLDWMIHGSDAARRTIISVNFIGRTGYVYATAPSVGAGGSASGDFYYDGADMNQLRAQITVGNPRSSGRDKLQLWDASGNLITQYIITSPNFNVVIPIPAPQMYDVFHLDIGFD